MRLQRYGFILLAFYAIFIMGVYTNNYPEVRWFSHILVTVLSLSWLGWRIKQGRGLPPSPINLPLFVLIIIGFLSIFFSYDPRMALENMWQTIIFTLIFLFIVNAFQRAQSRLVVETLFLIASIIILLSIIQIGSVFFGWGIVRSPNQGWINFLGTGISMPLQVDMRIFLPLGVSTALAGVVAPLAMICLTWAISVTKKSYRYILSGIFIALIMVLILTFSRGGLISITVGLLTFFTLHLFARDLSLNLLRRKSLLILGGLLSLIIIVAFAVLTIGSQSGRRSGDSVRLDLWRSAIEMTIDNPITGVGPGIFGRELREYREFETARDRHYTADNLYLTVIAENGLATIIVLLSIVWITISSWWKLRKETQVNSAEWTRLNGMMAALVVVATHNIFDTLTTYARIIVFAVIIIYCTVPPAKSRLEARLQGNQVFAGIAFLILLAYGIWFVAIVDPAHRRFIDSMNTENDQLALAQQAHEIDPYLNLYSLQVTYLIGENALNNPTKENLETAIQAYQDALVIEPTWDTGMINLAALYEANGNLDQAQQWLDTARNVILTNTARLHWARVAEMNNYEDTEAIILAYQQSMYIMGYLPLSDFWTATDLRQEALERYQSSVSLERQYRILKVHFPEQLLEIIPENPQTANEWWIIGEYTLTVEDDPQSAITAFSNAIALNSGNGDYYASRARAYAQIDIALSDRDWEIAQFLGTQDEYVNIIRANISNDPEEIEAFRRRAIPPLVQSQEFEGVLFAGRKAQFVPYAPMRFIGRGATVMQIWYDLAEQYEADGNIPAAIEVYEAIAFNTPENNRADQELERLQQ